MSDPEIEAIEAAVKALWSGAPRWSRFLIGLGCLIWVLAIVGVGAGILYLR